MKIAILALTIRLITLGVGANFTIQEVRNNPRLYFERLHDVKFSPVTWSLVVFIDMTPLRYNTTEISSMINDVEQSQHCIADIA